MPSIYDYLCLLICTSCVSKGELLRCWRSHSCNLYMNWISGRNGSVLVGDNHEASMKIQIFACRTVVYVAPVRLQYPPHSVSSLCTHTQERVGNYYYHYYGAAWCARCPILEFVTYNSALLNWKANKIRNKVPIIFIVSRWMAVSNVDMEEIEALLPGRVDSGSGWWWCVEFSPRT